MMKKILLSVCAAALVLAACNSDKKQSLDTDKQVVFTDTSSMKNSNASTDVPGTTAVVAPQKAPAPEVRTITKIVHVHDKAPAAVVTPPPVVTTPVATAPVADAPATTGTGTTAGTGTGTTTTNTATKTNTGWSSAAKDATIGGVGGAVAGAVIGKGKGAVIGGILGAAGGYILGRGNDKKTGRAN